MLAPRVPIYRLEVEGHNKRIKSNELTWSCGSTVFMLFLGASTLIPLGPRFINNGSLQWRFPVDTRLSEEQKILPRSPETTKPRTRRDQERIAGVMALARASRLSRVNGVSKSMNISPTRQK